MPKIKKVTEFSRDEVRRLGGAIEQALQKVGEQFGVHIARGNASFGPTNVTYKIEAALLGDNGEIRNREAENFKRYATMYGLKASDLGRTFTDWSGKEFEICGLATRRSKNPVLAKNTRTDKVYVWPVEEVKMLLKKV